METKILLSAAVVLWILMGCLSGYLEETIHEDDKWFLTMDLVIAIWIGWLAWPVIIPCQIKELLRRKPRE